MTLVWWLQHYYGDYNTTVVAAILLWWLKQYFGDNNIIVVATTVLWWLQHYSGDYNTTVMATTLVVATTHSCGGYYTTLMVTLVIKLQQIITDFFLLFYVLFCYPVVKENPLSAYSCSCQRRSAERNHQLNVTREAKRPTPYCTLHKAN